MVTYPKKMKALIQKHVCPIYNSQAVEKTMSHWCMDDQKDSWIDVHGITIPTIIK